MTTKIKEKIIALSRSKSIKKFMLIYSIITIVVCIISHFYEIEPVTSGLIIIAIVLWTMYGALSTIEGKKEEIVKSNKLIYIILSDEVIVFCYIMFFISCPIIEVVSILVQYNITIRTILMIASIIISSNLATVIGRNFKNKLSE